MNELDKWKAINSTRSIHDLIQTLDEIGDISISGNRGSFNMAARVKEVVNGAPINMLTRNYGIRQQYIYLEQL